MRMKDFIYRMKKFSRKMHFLKTKNVAWLFLENGQLHPVGKAGWPVYRQNYVNFSTTYIIMTM